MNFYNRMFTDEAFGSKQMKLVRWWREDACKVRAKACTMNRAAATQLEVGKLDSKWLCGIYNDTKQRVAGIPPTCMYCDANRWGASPAHDIDQNEWDSTWELGERECLRGSARYFPEQPTLLPNTYTFLSLGSFLKHSPGKRPFNRERRRPGRGAAEFRWERRGI